MVNSLSKKLNRLTKYIVLFVIMVSVILFTPMASISYAEETSIRPSATNATKVPEVIKDPTNLDDPANTSGYPYDVRNGNEDKIKFYPDFQLVSYYDTQKAEFADNDIKTSMKESWTSISSRSVASLNKGLTDDLAKTLGQNEKYTKSNYEITYFFDMTIGEDALQKMQEADENHIIVTFKLYEVKPTDPAPLILYRCADAGATADDYNVGSEWKLIANAKNNGDYTISVSFYDLTDVHSSILFIGTNDSTPTPLPDDDNSKKWDFPWWIILVIIVCVLIFAYIVSKISNSKNNNNGGSGSSGSGSNNFKSVKH